MFPPIISSWPPLEAAIQKVRGVSDFDWMAGSSPATTLGKEHRRRRTPLSRAQNAPAGENRDIAQLFLDADELIVLRDAVGP